MANDIYEYENLQEIEYGGLKVIVEAARRDSEGNTISTTYAKKADVQTSLRPGIDIININGQSILKSGNIDVYNKEEIDTRFNAVRTIQFRIVESLPETGESNIIYLLPEEGVNTNGTILNLYREFIYVDGKWEQIGRKEDNLNFKTINGQSITFNSAGDPTDIAVDAQIHLRIVNELPNAAVADSNSFYLIERNGEYDVYGRLDSMEWVKINSAQVDLSEINDRLDSLESDVESLQSLSTPVDLSPIEGDISDLSDRVDTLEGTVSTLSTAHHATKLSELENDVGYLTASCLKKPYTELQSANLDNMDTEGRYRIANASNYPLGGNASGTLKIEKIGNELNEEWVSGNIRAYRTASLENSDPTIVNSLHVISDGVDTEYTESTVELEADGYYEISGMLEGSIIINSSSYNENLNETTLVLNGVKLKNTTPTCVIKYVPDNGKLNVVLKENTKNYIYNTQQANANDLVSEAAIYSENDLIITGTGGLSIDSNTGIHGLKGSDVIIAGDPTIRISALHDCIHASKYAHIQYGTILLENGNDGIEAENSTGDKGIVQITGGNVTIRNCKSTSIHSRLPGIICGSKTVITLANNAYPINNVTILEDATISGETYQQESFVNYFGVGSVKYRTKIDTDENEDPVYRYDEIAYSSSYQGYPITMQDNTGEVEVSGFIAGRILILGGSNESNKTDIIFKGAYITNNGDNSTIAYNPTKSRLALDCEQYTVNYVSQTKSSSSNSNIDYDAIKSENNIELSGKGTLIVSSHLHDAIDGGQVAFKGNGARYFLDSGLRGIKASKLYLGGEKLSVASSSGSTVTYEGGAEDKPVYTNIYALGNNTTNDLGGSADIYCRNGDKSFLNGSPSGYYTVFDSFKGVVVANTFRSVSAQNTPDIAAGYEHINTHTQIYIKQDGTVLTKNTVQYGAVDSSDIFNPKELLFTDWRVFFAVPSTQQLDPSKNYVLSFANGRINWVAASAVTQEEIPVSEVPDNAIYDDSGNVFVDMDGNYLIIGD